MTGLILAAVLAAAAPQAEPITMSGAVPAAAVVADLAYFYRRTLEKPPRFEIVGGNTLTGLSDAARGVSDVGLVTRSLATGDPRGLRFTAIARTGFCLVTNRANPVPGFTRAQVQDLVAARVTSWAQVPGAARTDEIVAATFVPGGGARTVFESTFLDAATPVAYVPRTWVSSAQVRDYVQTTANAWGYVDLAYSRDLHTVPYEGVPCTRATVSDNTYPARSEIGLVTRGKPKGRIARFIRWIKRSPRARRVIASRYVPL